MQSWLNINNPLSLRQLSKHVRIKIYKARSLCIVCIAAIYDPTLREEQIYGVPTKGAEYMPRWKGRKAEQNCIMTSVVLRVGQNYYYVINSAEARAVADIGQTAYS